MAKRDPILLEAIQEAAKDNIDDQKLKMIFASSEGRAPMLMQEKSVSSRMITKEIHDLTVQEAKEYLLVSRRLLLSDEQVEYLVSNVTGTRIKILSQVANQIQDMGYYVKELKEKEGEKKQSEEEEIEYKRKLVLLLKEVEKEQLDQAATDFQAAQFNEREIDYVSKLVLLLREKGGRVDLRDFQKLVPSLEVRQRLVQPQVFSLHPEGHHVSFQSKRMERYAMDTYSLNSVTSPP